MVKRTQGCTLLLVECVRGLKDAGIVCQYQGARGFYEATDGIDRVPALPLIEWLAHRKIDALRPAERAHARLVATSGVEVTMEDVADVCYRDGQSRVDGLSEALRLPQRGDYAAHARHFAVAEDAYLQLTDAARARHTYVDAERLYTLALEQSDARLVPTMRQDKPASSRKFDAGASRSLHRSHRRDASRDRALMRYRTGRNHDVSLDVAEARAQTDPDAFVEHTHFLGEATAFDGMGDHGAARDKVLAAQTLAEGRSTPAFSAWLSSAMTSFDVPIFILRRSDHRPRTRCDSSWCAGRRRL